jgi:hypothetical protein
VSALSEYLNAHIPEGWTKRDLIKALEDDLDRTTVYRYLAGTHSPNPGESVLRAFARAMPGTSMVELRAAAGLAAGEVEPWVLPPEAQRLNRTQRAAIEVLIRAIANAQETSRSAVAMPRTEAQAEIRQYVAFLRQTGQDELADRLEASLETTNSASQTARRSSIP